jgi:hypothetical protein
MPDMADYFLNHYNNQEFPSKKEHFISFRQIKGIQNLCTASIKIIAKDYANIEAFQQAREYTEKEHGVTLNPNARYWYCIKNIFINRLELLQKNEQLFYKQKDIPAYKEAHLENLSEVQPNQNKKVLFNITEKFCAYSVAFGAQGVEAEMSRKLGLMPYKSLSSLQFQDSKKRLLLKNIMMFS